VEVGGRLAPALRSGDRGLGLSRGPVTSMFSDHRRSEGGEGVEPAGVDKAGGVDVGGGRRPTDRVLEDEPSGRRKKTSGQSVRG
jgi:hypothetical protein